MIRVTKTARRALIATRAQAWAAYSAMSAECCKHAADRAAGRAALHRACRDMMSRDVMLDIFERADRACSKIGF